MSVIYIMLYLVPKQSAYIVKIEDYFNTYEPGEYDRGHVHKDS